MKKQKIFVATINGAKQVEAVEVNVPEQKELRFFFHKTVYNMTFDEPLKNEDAYTITEFSTGLSVCKLRSKAACIKKLRERLKKFGEAKTLEIGKPVLARYNIGYPVNQ